MFLAIVFEFIPILISGELVTQVTVSTGMTEMVADLRNIESYI